MGDRPPHYKFFNEHPRYRKHLRSFGEMAGVACRDRKKTRTKIEERGRTVICVGHAEDHTGTDLYTSKQETLY